MKKEIKEIKQNLLKSLLATIGQNKICDSLAAIYKTYDILERELKQKWVEEIEKMKASKEKNYPAMTIEEIDAYNGALEDIKSLLTP